MRTVWDSVDDAELGFAQRPLVSGSYDPIPTLTESDTTPPKLVSEKYFDYPLALLPFLFYHIEKRIHRHLFRISKERRQAQKIYVHLSCEYDHVYHLIEVNIPNNCIVENIMDSVERALLDIDLDNPIRSIEVETIPTVSAGLSTLAQWTTKRQSPKARLISGVA